MAKKNKNVPPHPQEAERVEVKFHSCKMFEKTAEKYKADRRIKAKLVEFLQFKTSSPFEKFGSSDYPFVAGPLHSVGAIHAKLSFDVSIVYKISSKNVGGVRKVDFLLFGIFSHDESGTGQPSNPAKMTSLSQKITHADFPSLE